MAADKWVRLTLLPLITVVDRNHVIEFMDSHVEQLQSNGLSAICTEIGPKYRAALMKPWSKYLIRFHRKSNAFSSMLQFLVKCNVRNRLEANTRFVKPGVAQISDGGNCSMSFSLKSRNCKSCSRASRSPRSSKAN